jgi:hypothetical protein
LASRVAVVGVVLMLGLLLGRLTASRPGMTSVLATRSAVPAGGKVSRAGLRVLRMRSSKKERVADAVAASELSRVDGWVARESLPAGSILQHSQLAPSGGAPGPGQALLGLGLKPGQLPREGLSVGDRVGIVQVPTAPSGPPPAPVPVVAAPVWGISTSQTGEVEVTVLVPSSLSAALAGASARGELAVVRLDASSPWPVPA